LVPVSDGHGESESARLHGPLRELFAFRSQLHGCLVRRVEALFELSDALVGAGFSGRDAVRAAFLLTAYATHFVAEDTRFAGVGRANTPSKQEELVEV
jgi:hypothetical protein